MENLVCKLNVSNSMVLCFSVTPEDRSNMTTRLEPYPRKKEFLDPYKMVTHFSQKIVGCPREAPVSLQVTQCH